MPDPSPDTPEPSAALGWWTISGEGLMEMMRRCANGEEPDLVYAEEYANSDHEWHGGDDA